MLSIINQTFVEWELIVINDGSSDQSLQLLTAYALKDDRISIFQNTGNGIIPALQLALSHAKGAFITRIDADDIMPPDRLTMMHAQLVASPKRYIVTGLVKYFSNQPISEGYLKYEKWLNEINKNSHTMEKRVPRVRNRIAQLDHANGRTARNRRFFTIGIPGGL